MLRDTLSHVQRASQYASSSGRRNIATDEMIKVILLVITVVALSLCRQCDEELVGFRKIGLHRKSPHNNGNSKLGFKVTSALSDAISRTFKDSTDVNANRYAKIFYLSMDFEGNWMESRSFCKTFDMDLVSFDTSYEFSNFVRQAMKNVHYFDKWTHIGGVSKVAGKQRDWYWIANNRKVVFPMQFATGHPNNYLGRQNCLGISKEEKTFEFQDIDCWGKFEEKFICQKICLYD